MPSSDFRPANGCLPPRHAPSTTWSLSADGVLAAGPADARSTAVLLVDDDRELGQMLVEFMGDDALELHLAHDGAEAMDTLGRRHFDLVVLDVMLPGLNGFQLLQALRQRSPVPVIMMTARTAKADRIAGLEMGADDYVCKPVDPAELLARIRAVLRRSGTLPAFVTPASDIACVGAVRVSSSLQRATIDEVDLGLTAAELRLLDILVRHAGTPVSRENLTEWALGRSLEAFDRSLDTHISNLRRKLRQAGGERPLPQIRSLRRLGYLLTPGPAD